MDTEQIEHDFTHLKDNDSVLAVLVFGSQVTGTAHEQSDTDICIVAPDTDPADILLHTLGNPDTQTKDYDIHVFEELSLTLQHRIIQDHEIIWCRDESALQYYFYKRRSLWNDQAKARGIS